MVLPRLTVLDGRYAIGRALDASPPLVFAYQAWNLHTEDQVVLQEFLPTFLAHRAEGSLEVDVVDPAQEDLFRYGRDQFLKETAVLAALDHPNLVHALERFEAHGTAYRVLEHHKGAALASVLEKQGGTLPPKTAFAILIPLLDALHAAHQRGLIHGAFSPQAVFLAKGRGPLLRGFRTTHVMLAQRTGDRQLLVEDGVSAPEQYEANGRQGPWTDIYGSAATLFQMLTGRVLPAAPRRLEEDEVPALLQQADGVPDALRHLLERALSLDSAQRPRLAQTFRQQLLDVLKKKATPVVSAPPVAQASEPAPEAPSSEPSETVVEEEPAVGIASDAPVESQAPVTVVGETSVPVDDDAPRAFEAETVVLAEEEPAEPVSVDDDAPVESEAPVTIDDDLPFESEAPMFDDDAPMTVDDDLPFESEAPRTFEAETVVLAEEEPAEPVSVEETQAAPVAPVTIDDESPVRLDNETPFESEAPVAIGDDASVESEAPMFVDDEPPVTIDDDVPVASGASIGVHEEIAAPEEIEVASDIEAQEDQAAKEVAAMAARAQAAAARSQRPSGPRRRHADREAVGTRRRGVPVLAALAVVVLIALSGAYVLMQKEGSEVAQFSHFKAQGDSLFAMANYIEAKTQYENALASLPNNEYVTNRLDETYQRLDEVKDIRYSQFLIQGDRLYALGDSLLDAGNTSEALSSFAEANKAFYEALRYRPNDPDALEKGRLTTEGMEAALSQPSDSTEESVPTQGEQDPVALRQQLYTSYRQQGDALFTRGDYAGARDKFSKALAELPRDPYAAAKITEIDTLLAATARDEQHQQLVDQGLALNDQRRYEEARGLFRQAQALKPGDAQANTGLAHADSMLAAAARDEEYRRFREEGDALMRENKRGEAVESYQQALVFKPGDVYATRRVQDIQQALEDELQQASQEPEETEPQPASTATLPEDGIYAVVDEAPELIGGLKDLHSKVTYPESARRQDIEGRVYVQFVITENGEVEAAKVIRGIGGGCDEEALRVVREARFVPGKLSGKPVKVRHTLFVTFRLK